MSKGNEILMAGQSRDQWNKQYTRAVCVSPKHEHSMFHTCLGRSENLCTSLRRVTSFCRSPANRGIMVAESWPGDAANTPGRGATCWSR